MLLYDIVVDLPLLDQEQELLGFMVDKIREVAYPRLHVRFEADNRRDLDRKLRELNVELQSRGLAVVHVENFSRGTPGTL